MEYKEIVKNPWFFESSEVLKKLSSSLNGLSEEEAQKRLETFGLNDFKKKKTLNVPKLIIKQLISPLIFILIGASVLTGLLQEWLNMSIIIGAILINAGLGFYREYQAENTLEKLESYIKERSRVIRDGKEEEIDSSLLVPGDIIKLSYGTRVPADARLISTNNFKVDEAILTGESMPEVKKEGIIDESTPMADRLNMVYAGTLIIEGFSTAIVTETGSKTEIGKIASLVSKTDRVPTPIQKGITQLSWYIFILVIFIISAIFVLGISRGEPILQMMILSVAVAVGAVPEALPIALTVILSVGAERIASKKGIIRKLAAAETLGSATLIMTDKTGTLTKADMRLVDIHDYQALVEKDYSLVGVENLSPSQKNILEMTIKNINVLVQNPNEIKEDWVFVGHPLEVNIAKAALSHNFPIDQILSGKNFLHLPFNSSNKFSVSKSGHNCIIMGAPDILLEKAKMDKDSYLKISSWIQKASIDGKRLIAIGSFNSEKLEEVKSENIEQIKFMGILSFFDPVREEVPAAIKNIEDHGAKVVMITGDLKGTAISVAKSLDWNVLDNEVLTGEDIHQMTDEQLLEVIPKIKVFARVSPEDKLRIGNLYQQLGEIVAMTGDGVNDAPALKAMDIGISLGTGSDVAQSAADLVLLDNNFQTISMAIDEGRRIMTNIRKTFVYLMSNSLDSIFVISGSLIMHVDIPINALQIIWVNLFTGSLPALAYAYDENLDKGIRKSKSKKMLSREVKLLSFGVGVITSLLLFVIYYQLLRLGVSVPIARSIFFVCFSIYILVVAFSFRSLYRPIFSYNPFSNKNLNIAIAISFSLLVITMTTPFMRNIFNLAPLPFSWLWFIFIWIIFNISLVEFAKWVFRCHVRLLVKRQHRK